jgi:hypothetical protein
MQVDPAANGGYVTAAYIVTAVILLSYAFRLYRRLRGPED